MKDLTQGPIPRHLVQMAIPIAVGMLVMTLYYLVDLYFVSRLGDVAIAAVSAAGNTMFIVMALTQMLNVGTVAVVSHAVGDNDQLTASGAFNQALVLAALLGCVALLGGYFLATQYMRAVSANGEIVAAGLSYLKWFIPGLALQFAMTAQAAALQGTGIVKPTMVVQMITVVVNIILTPVLIAGWGTGVALGVEGAAIASLLSIALGVVLMTYYFHKLEHYVGFDLALCRPRLTMWRRILGIGFPSGAEFLLMFAYVAVIYSVISGFGASAQAGFGVGVRVMQAIFLPAMAVAFAVPAIAGQNFGARNAERVRGTFRTAALFSSVIMLFLSLLCQLVPEWLVAPFASDDAVLAVAALFITIISWNFVAQGLIFTCAGMFQGMGNTWPGLISTATRIVTFVFPALWLSGVSGFRIEHVWYLSVATVTLQCLLSLALLYRQFGQRLRWPARQTAAATS